MSVAESPSSPGRDPEPATGQRHLAHTDAGRFVVHLQGQALLVDGPRDGRTGLWQLDMAAGTPRLAWSGSASAPRAELQAVLEAVFQFHPGLAQLALATGLGPCTAVDRAVFWQQTAPWLPRPRTPQPLQYTASTGRRHPRRTAKPEGLVYRRFIPWLDSTFSLRCADTEADLPVFHRWMNDPVVAYFWEEQGDLRHHWTYLERTAADPHALGLIACLDGEPFGYIEAYWALEDRIAPFYDVGEHDRGWHALVGESRFRGRSFLTAWLPSISHYLFLDDPRTRRIVVEPRADNRKMLRSLPRCGYELLKEFDFPHKRAVLGMLSRERFFAEALWIPQSGAAVPGP